MLFLRVVLGVDQPSPLPPSQSQAIVNVVIILRQLGDDYSRDGNATLVSRHEPVGMIDMKFQRLSA
jgi:hypothetical protein